MTETRSVLLVTTSLIQFQVHKMHEDMWMMVQFDFNPVIYYIGNVTKVTSDPAGAEVS